MDSLPEATQAVPGWYSDPAGSGRMRWWDGTRWTESFQDAATVPIPPGLQHDRPSFPVNEQFQPRPRFSKSAVTGFVMGCIGMFILPYIGVAATVVSLRGLRVTRQTGLRGRGFAIGGLILGVIEVIYLIVVKFIFPS